MSNPALVRYLASIRRFERLTPEEEATATPQQLVEGCLRFVVHIAKRYATGSSDLLECIQNGNVGLVLAANKYVPGSKFCFAQLASLYIRSYIREGKRTDKLVKIHMQVAAKRKNVISWVEEGLTDREICTKLGIKSCLDIRGMMCQQYDSTNEETLDDEGETRVGTVLVSEGHSVDTLVELQEGVEHLKSELGVKAFKAVAMRSQGFPWTEVMKVTKDPSARVNTKKKLKSLGYSEVI